MNRTGEVLSPAAWGNLAQRTTATTPAPVSRWHALGGASHPQPAPLPPPTGAMSAAPWASGVVNESRFGVSQNGVGPMVGGMVQPKTSSIEDFPPLGRTAPGKLSRPRPDDGAGAGDAGWVGHRARHGIGHGLNPPPPGLTSRNEMLNDGSTLLNNGGPSRLGLGMASDGGPDIGGLGSATSSMETIRPGQATIGNNLDRMGSISSLAGTGPPLAPLGAARVSKAPADGTNPMSTRQAFMDPAVRRPDVRTQLAPTAADMLERPQSTQLSESWASMSELDRFGLAGLLQMIRNESSDIGAIAVGQDLTALGLELNQPEPLYHTFSSPFAEAGSRPIEPDYYIPPCYIVNNVRPIHEQVTSFTDETLFYIFYSMPRDIMQELAAVELTNRTWRYHKELKQWLTKDNNIEPVRTSATEERGYYIFFDTATWQRQRREFVLRYEDLESRLVSITGPPMP